MWPDPHNAVPCHRKYQEAKRPGSLYPDKWPPRHNEYHTFRYACAAALLLILLETIHFQVLVRSDTSNVHVPQTSLENSNPR